MECTFTKTWEQANRKLLAKSLAELIWEELLVPDVQKDDGWQLQLTGGVVYRFQAWRNIWDQPVIDPDSIRRIPDNQMACARQFYIDAQTELGMSSATLSNFLEELANTLMADSHNGRQQPVSAEELVLMPDDQLQAFLDGHPKITANKGRMGWGQDDYQNYATEHAPEITLVWLALHREHCQVALAPDYREQDLVSAVLDSNEQEKLETVFQQKGLSHDRYLLIPVHPWQWLNKLVAHFSGELACDNVVYLGEFGDSMRPLQSLRTLANHQRPEQPHIKLPLTILNTSCYRGIPGRFITAGPIVSRWLSDIASQDEVLRARRSIILEEPAGIFYSHPLYQQINDSPYRFQEMLGCIWRQSVNSHLEAGERSLLMSALFQKDDFGQPLISEYIGRSGLDTETWLQQLFEVVVVPLYHLLCRYGVGLVAHGQNITLVLKDWVPARVALKDFQGDLRLTEDDYPEQEGLPEEVRNTLGRLPENYLVHDLLTGHFVTVLRFISTVLAEQQFSEQRFYRILADTLHNYMASQPDLEQRFQRFDLFSPSIERVCLHRVRFRLGYDDSAERPVPELGTPLKNPLFLSLKDNNNDD